MRSVRFLVLGSSLALLALGGFGCKTVTNYDYSARTAPRPKPGTTITTPAENSAVATSTSDAFEDVRTVVENLSKATNFRAHMILPTPNGSATGDLEFQKNQGFHGTLLLPGAIMTELYALGSDLWFRTSDTEWTNLKGTPQGAETAETFRGAFTFGDVTSTLFLEDMKLIETAIDRDGCKRYVFERAAPPGDETLQVCVKNGLPVYISSATQSEQFEIRYRDFGKTITLKAPIIK